MKKTFLILILIFVFGGFVKSTANDIFIADTTLSRHYPADIRVQGFLDSTANSVKITLKYNPYQLNIIAVSSDLANVFMDSVPVFNIIEIDSNTNRVEVQCKNIKSNGKYFFKIKLQALIDKDSIFILEPVGLEIDGVSTIANFKAGNFLVKNPIERTNKSGIGYAYPNPFKRVTTIEYVLFEDAYLDITIYDAYGRLVRSIKRNDESTEFYFLNSEKQSARFNPAVKLQAGRYYMDWYPSVIWASTAYYIVFNIGGEFFSTTVMMSDEQ